MKEYTFTKPDDVRDFVEELISRNMNFHLDDDPKNIIWSNVKTEDLKNLRANWVRLWDYCNPWEILDNYPQTWAKYLGE